MSTQNTGLRDEPVNGVVEIAVQLSAIEIFLGSILHAFHIPFGGHFLSLNQGFFLCHSSLYSKGRVRAFKRVIEISFIVSTMKALAPAGKKLGPMISISTQGFLFGLGNLALGPGRLGQALGMLLLSLWAFIQPGISYYLIYGGDLFQAFSFFSEKFAAIGWFLIGLVALKLTLALCIPFLANHFQMGYLEKKLEAIYKRRALKVKKRDEETLKGIFKDLIQPFFLLSLICMSAYFYLNGREPAFIFWKLLRSIAIATLIFYVARSRFTQKGIRFLASRNKFIQKIYFHSSLVAKRLLHG